jgi:hypothetical protein
MKARFIGLRAALLACSLLTGPGVALAKTTVVTTTPQLKAAIAAAVSGDVIRLAPVKFAFFMVEKPQDFGPAGITITSQFPDRPASIAGLNLGNWSHVTISHLIVTWSVEQNAIIDLAADSHISLDHLDMNGSGATGPEPVIVGTSSGLNILGKCVECSLTNSLIHNTLGGITLSGDRTGPRSYEPNPGPVLVSNNEIWNINGDGIYGVYSNKTTISHNTIHDFVDPKDGSHADALQFENDAAPIDDLTVTDNWFYSGASTYGFQGIFLIGYPGFGPLNRLDVQRNTVCSTGQHNGLYITGAKNFVVKDNYISSGYAMKIHIYESDAGAIENNAADSIDMAKNTNVSEKKSSVIRVPRDCALAAAHAAAMAAGATPRNTLGPQGVSIDRSAAP